MITRRSLVPPQARNCLHCATKRLDAVLVRYQHRFGAHALIVEDVPCLRCPECGEEYLDIATLKTIESAHNAFRDRHRNRDAGKRAVFGSANWARRKSAQHRLKPPDAAPTDEASRPCARYRSSVAASTGLGA